MLLIGMRDIRSMLESLGIKGDSQKPFMDCDNSGAKGRKVYFFNLPRRECEGTFAAQN